MTSKKRVRKSFSVDALRQEGQREKHRIFDPSNEYKMVKKHSFCDWYREHIWSMVPVVKPNGKIRICVDLRKLNEAVKRERYILPTLEDVAPKLAQAKVFSELDA